MDKTNLKVLGITIILFFILLEVSLRFILVPPSWPQREAQHSDNPNLIYELKPNLDIIDKGPIVRLQPVRIKTDSNGLREDEEHPFEKPEGTFRIAMVGDSITFGMYVEQNQTFGHILESELNANLPSNSSIIKYETLNFGVPGYNTQQEYEIIKEKVLKYNPDLVILNFVLNDINEEAEDPFTPIRNIGRHIYSLRLIYWSILKSSQNMPLGVVEPQELSYEDFFSAGFYLRKISTSLKEQNIKFIVVGPFCFKSYECPVTPSERLSEIAGEQHFFYFNTNKIYDNINNKDIIIPKEGHPNSLAYKILAKDIYNRMIDEGII